MSDPRQDAMPAAFGVPSRSGTTFATAAECAADFGYPRWDRARAPADIKADLALVAARSDLHAIARAEAFVDLGTRAARVGARRLERRVLRDAWWQTRFADLVERRRAA